MANTSFVHPLTVTLYDLDLRGEVPCSTIFRYFEETAMRGSSHFGFTLEWYREHGQFWVIRTLQLERSCAPQYMDELEIRTWISSMTRVRSDRNYEIRRATDRRVIARGIANWVYIDAAQLTPTRIPPEITGMFDAHEPPALYPIGKVLLDSGTPAQFEQVMVRRAQFYEADSAHHVNNAVYVDWIEEAVRAALGAMGCTLALDGSTPLPWFYRHALEYVQAALPDDEIEIRARLMQQGKTRSDWQIEILHAASRAQVLRARTTVLWVDASNQPVAR